jgi:hypothetical protein
VSVEGDRRRSWGGRLVVVSLALAAVAAVVLAVARTGTRVAVTADRSAAGQPVQQRVETRRTMPVETEGASVLVVLAIPVLVAGFPLLFRTRPAAARARGVAAVLLMASSAWPPRRSASSTCPAR